MLQFSECLHAETKGLLKLPSRSVYLSEKFVCSLTQNTFFRQILGCLVSDGRHTNNDEHY